MTQDEIIAITRKLRICELTSKPKQDIHYSLTIHEMQTFAKLVAAKEREALAQTQEPDYWLGYGLQAHTKKPFEGATPVYTRPQRTWVGLTEEEFKHYCSWIYPEILNEIENKLKENNT